jgi:2'-5' RNA ligase
VNRRIQLSLYVPQSASAELETVRGVLDPVQASLIPAHVTLCREDEIQDLDPSVLRSRLAAPEATPVTLRFGPPEQFHGHGVMLPCVAGEPEFKSLRQWVLGSLAVRHQAPHITLAHPRNPKSARNALSDLPTLPNGIVITFNVVSRIQQDGIAPWQVLEQYTLGTADRATPNPSIERTGLRPTAHVKR